MAKATLLLDFRPAQGELLVQMVLWQLPRSTKDRPHGLKYRLYLGQAGKTLVRYDNEAGKEIIATWEPMKRRPHMNFRHWKSC